MRQCAYEVDPGFLIQRLADLGWIDNREALRPEQLAETVVDYQEHHGLTPDGWAGPVTERSLRALRICGRPERLKGQRGSLCMWPTKEITWALDKPLPGLSRADQLQAFDPTIWSTVCGLTFRYQTNPRTANVVISAGRIDGANQTLAWSEMPCGVSAGSQLEQRYDTSEKFVVGRPGRYEIDLVPTARHEWGHAIGIDHLSDGNLLQSTYDESVREPQAGDIAEAQRRYGLPAVVAEPGQRYSIEIELPPGVRPEFHIPGHRVTRLPS